MSSLQKGNIPPQAIDLEEAVLGAMLIDKSSVNEVLMMLTKESFYEPKNKLVFEAIKDVYLEENKVDILTVSHKLKSKNNLEKAGGDYYLIGLSQKVASSAHVDYHSRIILQKSIARELISISTGIIKDAYKNETDSLDLIERAYSQLNTVSESNVKPEEKRLGEVLAEVVDRGIKIFDNEIEPGLITPITKITTKDGGWRNGELIILAARPGMGKTSFALSCGLVPAKRNIPVAFFSLEMSKAQLASRLASIEFKIDNSKFTKTGLGADELARIDEALNDIPFYIDDTPAMSVEGFQIKANQMKSKYGIGLIIVDYLQLMTSKSNKGNREQEISTISRKLKAVAKELNIPVIALSQLSRAVETRGGSKRPLLSDLRESGAIEQDADMVSFLYRPEYYGLSEWDDDDTSSCIGEAEYICAKNRNGSTYKTRIGFEGRYTLFSDLETYQSFEDNPIPKGTVEDAFGTNEDNNPF